MTVDVAEEPVLREVGWVVVEVELSLVVVERVLFVVVKVDELVEVVNSDELEEDEEVEIKVEPEGVCDKLLLARELVLLTDVEVVRRFGEVMKKARITITKTAIVTTI